MSALTETLLTAFCVSGLAGVCLLRLGTAPPGVRLAVAAGGLAAWIVPWGALRIALPAASTPAVRAFDWLDAARAAVVPTPPPWSPEPGPILACLFAAAVIVGLALFARDCLALRSLLQSWRSRSRSGAELRALLPPELAGIRADIRIVDDSSVAAASGVLRPTIWLGDRLSDAERRLALLHESWHVRANDPLRLALIAAVRRAYWWNPLVAHLARQAILMIESTCDHRCARQIGKNAYVGKLASMLLAARSPVRTLSLVAAVDSPSFAVQRLRLLHAPLRLRRRDYATLAALAVATAATAAAAVVDLAAPPAAIRAGSTVLPLPATAAGRALASLIGAVNAGDTDFVAEQLGAYTPQELPLPLPPAPGVRVVDVLRSEPFRIEFVVEAEDGRRHTGALSIAPSGTAAIVGTQLQPAR